MKSNYKPIGDYIRRIDVRNTDLRIEKLQGIRINKEFMPSVANVIGTDLSKYRHGIEKLEILLELILSRIASGV